MRGIAMAIIAAGLIIGANFREDDQQEEKAKGVIAWAVTFTAFIVILAGL